VEPEFKMPTLTLTQSIENLTRTLDSTLANIDVAETVVLTMATRAGFAGLDLSRIGLAVREITTNAIVHGNRYDLGKKVFVAASRTPDRLEITIADQGSGFDPDSVADCRSVEALLRPSGRGLYLARAFMDELHVRRGDLCGTAVVMVKYVDRFPKPDALYQ
jgi:serine/threonine-protein kinase RsbW